MHWKRVQAVVICIGSVFSVQAVVTCIGSVLEACSVFRLKSYALETCWKRVQAEVICIAKLSGCEHHQRCV